MVMRRQDRLEDCLHPSIQREIPHRGTGKKGQKTRRLCYRLR